MKKTKNNKKNIIQNNQGFTLLEILTIVVIIGLLVGAILVSLRGIRENSEKKSLISTMNTVTKAANVCINTGRGINPVGAGNSICDSGSSDSYPSPYLDEKIINKGYDYSLATWNGSEWYVGFQGSVPTLSNCFAGGCLVVCDIDRGSCEEL